MAEVRRYARRLLGPLRGVAHVVETADGRGVTTDGVDWSLELPLVPAAATSRLYAWCAQWSADAGRTTLRTPRGFRRADVVPRLDRLQEAVATALPELPFRCVDRYECWLVDRVSRVPFALVATTARGVEATGRSARGWAPTPVECLAPRDRRGPDDPLGPLGQRVAERIARRAGGHVRGRWFERESESRMRPLDPAPGPAPTTRRGLPLDLAWDDPDDRAAVDGYLARLAPLLLTLPGLAPAEYRWLERRALAQPASVASRWRLYPRGVDAGFVTTARVAARLAGAPAAGRA